MPKRIICILAESLLLFGLMVGCSAIHTGANKGGGERLSVMIVSTASEDAVARISTKVSLLAEEKLGFSVELIPAPLTSYNSILSQLETLGRAPDIFLAYQQSSLVSFTERGAVLPLNTLLLEFDVLNQKVYDGFWPNVSLDGKIYGIPTNDETSYAQGFIARKDILDSLGIDPAEITNWDELHQMLLTVKENRPDVVPVVPHQGRLFATLEEDPLNDGIGVLPYSSGTVVENYYESQDFYALCNTMRQWYSEGLILEEGFSYTKEPRNVLMSAFNGLGYFARLNDITSTNGCVTTGYPLVNIQLSQPYINTSVTNLCWCISAHTSKSRQAMQLIELLYTDKEMADLCLYGQEGVDYSRIDENRVTFLGNSGSWNSTPWGWPNRRVASLWVDPDTMESTVYEITGQPVVSPANGFVFNSAPVQQQLEKCLRVVEKYENPLLCGYLDPEEVIPLFNEELYRAGIEAVNAEKQRQLDLFLGI